MTIKWVVFDLGHVVLRGTVALPRLAELLTVDQDAATAAYFAHRVDYDLHSDATRYFRAIAAGLGRAAPDEKLIAELTLVDDLGWSVPDADTILLLEDLFAAGVALAVLSNAPSSMGRLIESQDWAGRFRHLVFSGDLGIAKPDPGIYRELLGRLQAEASEVAFLDDRADNIAGALAVGIHGLQFTDAVRARTELRGLGLPV
jgi:putative hydrolase of the HAD superfamily